MRRHPTQRSTLVPFKPGESGSARHERRLDVNLRYAHKMKEWCDANGITLKIHNGGHHWVFTKGKEIAEWWPSSAKLVYARKYDNHSHKHDFAAVIKSLRHWFLRKPK